MKISVLLNHDFDAPGARGVEACAEIAKVAEAVAKALRRRPGARVEILPCRGDSCSFVDRLRADPPDLVFNLCESLAGDSRGEAAVPAILDALGLAYTGSGAATLALALHKPLAGAALRGSGVPVPPGVCIAAIEELEGTAAAVALDAVGFPAIVKQAREDASVGITRASVVRDRPSLRRQVLAVLEGLGQEALVERYVDGREIYAAFLGDGLLLFTEIDFSAVPEGRPRIVTYDAKWIEGSEDWRQTPSGPARIDDPALRARIEQVALAAFRALGLRDYGRVDLRVDADGRPWVVDVNANCGLAPDAGFAGAAAAAGLSHPAMIGRIVDAALARHHARPPRHAR
ncbi:MAG TPA: D-alanine--D-alanine ligase [Vulgatibacter sp.]|nr:D-alanine--D-alanine ligase [Vulgatibacter sp.]